MGVTYGVLGFGGEARVGYSENNTPCVLANTHLHNMKNTHTNVYFPFFDRSILPYLGGSMCSIRFDGPAQREGGAVTTTGGLSWLRS